MTGSAAKKPSIPAWQRTQPALPGAEESTPPPAPEPKAVPSQPGAEESTKAPDDIPLLEQASKFLQDPSIQDAPKERKVAFLQAKGVRREDIDKLLGAESTLGSSMSQETATVQTKPTPTTPPPAQPHQQPPRPTRDVPPIITYPEFLAIPQKPPPLITTTRLLNTLTLAGGFAASLYGLSRYVLHPVFDSLTAARHELYAHTATRLDDLNAKLASMASSDPTTSQRPRHPVEHQEHDGDDASEVSSIASDPSELYHRDVGTQTSPSISRRASSSTPSTPSADANTSPDAVAGHANRLAIMTSHLSELLASAERNTATADSLHSELDDLKGYLTELSYLSAGYWGGGGVYGGGGYGGGYGNGTAGAGKGKKEDGIEAVRAEIRAVKGVLLAARNFPGGGGRGR